MFNFWESALYQTFWTGEVGSWRKLHKWGVIVFKIYEIYYGLVGRVAQSVWRLATGWTVQGSNPGEGEIYRTCPDRPWGPPSLLYNGYRVFPGGKERSRRDADPSTLSSAVVMKGQSYTSTPPMGPTASTEPQCLYKDALYLFVMVFKSRMIGESYSRNDRSFSRQTLKRRRGIWKTQLEMEKSFITKTNYLAYFNLF